MSVRTRVALTGFGSVGQALAQILADYPNLPLSVVLVADSSGYVLDPNGLDLGLLLEVKGRGALASHPGGQRGTVDAAVLEASGATLLLELASTNYTDGGPGWSYLSAALNAGLDVVLASKGPLVVHWDALHDLAVRRGCRVRYSATHGAPLPAIDMARVGLAGSALRGVRALLNSTTGLLLEQMELGCTLQQAVEVVSGAGVAETDPRLDIEGFDAAAKCVILGRSLFGGRLTLDDVDRAGIENLTSDEVVAAARAGTPIKLVCVIRPGSAGPVAIVRPEPLPREDPLSTLRDGALGIVYDADPVGPMFLAAYGAGGRPTAAAVIRDVLSLRLDEIR